MCLTPTCDQYHCVYTFLATQYEGNCVSDFTTRVQFMSGFTIQRQFCESLCNTKSMLWGVNNMKAILSVVSQWKRHSWVVFQYKSQFYKWLHNDSQYYEWFWFDLIWYLYLWSRDIHHKFFCMIEVQERNVKCRCKVGWEMRDEKPEFPRGVIVVLVVCIT